ncbi:MAG: SUMF1/EgtB/PvdO family nonheme iron enzyme [Candidatus Sabulitectum sp.]|nr:SUMF1/EgtB/PvdO family nonheme iron enzyme [Candidatus Sabulitectum sp.]
MKNAFIPLFFVLLSVSYGQTVFAPVTGELLEHWNNTSRTARPMVYYFDTDNLSNGIYEVVITGIEVEPGLLDMFLLGKTHDSEIPLLLGTSEYRGNYNFAKSDSRYNEEEDEISLYFQMPGSASYYAVCYRWDIDSGSLELLRYFSGDPSMEALERADSLMTQGKIAEAIREIDEMFYPGNYYDSDEMFVRLLRSVNRAAGETGAAGNFGEAVSLFGDLAGFLHTDREWFTAFSDSLDYVNCDYSEYMGLGEYAMIMNDYAYYLEQTGDLDKSLIVLRKVLDLKPERMVAHLNIADVLWALGEFVEAQEHYGVYTGMMTDRELTHQIPGYVQERLAEDPLSLVDPVTISILSEHLCPIETMRWDPILIDGYQMWRAAGFRVQLNRHLPRNMVSFNDELWTVDIDADGYLESCEEAVSSNSLIMTTDALDGSREMSLIACTEQSDTAWTCSLERTDREGYWSPCVTELSDGGYIVSNSPDAFVPFTEIQRISSDGEALFHYSMSSMYLLDLPEGSGEIWPRIQSFRETSAGNILACGKVQEWVTDPDLYFVCLLDGDTGIPLWKITGAGLGEATIYDVVETSSGMIVAVGATAVSFFPEGQYYSMWGRTLPFIAVIDGTGVLQKTIVFDLGLTDLFSSIIEKEYSENEFLIAGSDSLSNQMVFLRAIIPTDIESWERGSDTPVLLIDSDGDEYSQNEFGVFPLAVNRLPFGNAGPASGMEFVIIPSGSFNMGDQGQHRVSIDSFELMTTEVTQGMWKEVMNENHNSGSDYGVGPLNPVHNVTWNECRNFIAELNRIDPNSTYRLPSESEWEYSCRAGTTTDYYWGNTTVSTVAETYCWLSENSGNSTQPVRLLEPNPWGLFDMLGNVSEWCADVYTSDLNDCPADGSAFAGSGHGRVSRGGSFSLTAVRPVSTRSSGSPDCHYVYTGLRVARDARKTPEEVVTFFMDMVFSSDGEDIISGLSEEELADFNAVLRVMKLAPDEMAAELSSGGIEITAEDIENMTIDEFVMVMLGSAEIEIGEATINGETALVPVTIEGETEEIQLVLENGQWVVVDNGTDLF